MTLPKIPVLLFSGALLLTAPAFAAPSTFLIQSEDFQFPGDWNEESDGGALGSKLLRTLGADLDAVTVVSFPETARYNVWVRTKDFTVEPGKRRFKLTIDGEPFEQEIGAHGKNGWAWQKAGTREIPAGDHVLGLRDTARFFGRSDAILFAVDDKDPNVLSKPQQLALARAPKVVDAKRIGVFASAPKPGADRKEVARLENENVRLRFTQSTGSDGKPQITREMDLKVGGAWRALPVDASGEKLFVLQSANTEYQTPTYFPAWNTKPSLAPSFEFTVAGKKYVARQSGNNPFFAAPAEALVPRSVRKNAAGQTEVTYEAPSGLTAIGRWELPAAARDVKFTLDYTAPKEGAYSFGFSPFQSWTPEQIQFNLLSPLFQYNRLPKFPVMMTSAVTPHPVAMAQVELGGQPYSLAVAADPDKLPFEWAKPNNARYGFSLLNEDGLVQPTTFSPVLGQDDSRMKAGQRGSVTWRLLAFPGEWKSALEYASKDIYGVTDYRKPYGATLSEAALNMVDLMKDANATGWSDRIKGFYNIESPGVASQASPLTVVEASVLTRDEDLYVKRALPTIEYTLSRPGAHFALKVPDSNVSYVNENTIKLKVPSDFYGAAYWQGLYDLTGRANGWMTDFAYEGGQARHRSSYSSMPRWSEMMGAYRLKPSPELLAQIKTAADEFLAKEIYGKPTRSLGVSPFYNVSYYPYWWDLLDLYEVTKEKKYLDAAEQGGFLTVAGLWSHPKVPAGNVTIHPGGEYEGNAHMWWKDEVEYRLGYPRKAGDVQEKQVPAWLVSQMGLGLEQPSTYYGGGNGGLQNIMMSAWAPNLLRLYRYTGRDIFRTYSRNTIISRFGNYPGYYLRGHSDVHMQADYPYKGPDLTSIYYHHIPPQLAFTIDYLVTEAVQRSNAQIDFPWSKQQGYVWFTNRVYGQGPGNVFGDNTARLWLDRNAAKANTNALNVLLARGTDRVWVILMNETDAPVTTPVILDRAALGLTGTTGTIYSAAGQTTPVTANTSVPVTVPAKGLIAVSLPARVEQPTAIPPLQGGRASQKLSGDWGNLEAFRIRSPFGKDSLYVVMTGRPAEGAEATLQMEGSAPVQRKMFPYEFSVYPVSMDKDMKFTLSFKDANGTVTQSQPISLAGTK